MMFGILDLEHALIPMTFLQTSFGYNPVRTYHLYQKSLTYQLDYYICFCFSFPLHLQRQKTKSRPVKKSLIFYHVFDFTSTYFWERENLVGQSLRFKGSCWRHYSISTILKLWQLNTLSHKQIQTPSNTLSMVW